MSISSTSEFRRNFVNIFHSKVKPAIMAFEKERVKTRRNATLLAWLVFIVISVGIYFLVRTDENLYQKLLFIPAFSLSPAYLVYRYFKKNFEYKIKTVIMPILMPAFGNFQWQSYNQIDFYEIKMSKLFTEFEKMSCDDNFVGSYKDVPIRISETTLTYTTRDSNGHRSTHTEFKGVLISLEIPKRFTGHTIVKPRCLLDMGPYKEVKLEDPNFSKKFYVSSNDQVEARYLLTPAFMERYKNIQQAFNSNDISCSFLDNKLLLAVPVIKDLFSLGSLNKPLDDTTQFTIFLNEIISILDMVEELKVYQNIGL